MIRLSCKPVNHDPPVWIWNLWNHYGSWAGIKHGLQTEWNGRLEHDGYWECIVFEDEKDATVFLLRWS